ncbi:MAG: hypothetical protein MJ238_00065 [Bacilli bacterium]|nr:hypothetical protein [Bacilli bacterium]
MDKKKNKYPAKSVFMAGIVTFAIGVVALIASTFTLFNGTTNLVFDSFAKIFGVIGGAFTANASVLGGAKSTLAAIAVAFVGFVVEMFFVIDFAVAKKKRATVAAVLATLGWLFICLMLECFLLAREANSLRIRYVGAIGIIGILLALSLFALTIFMIVSYMDKVNEEAAQIKAENEPVADPADTQEPTTTEVTPEPEPEEDDSDLMTGEELRMMIKEEIEIVLANREEKDESVTEKQVREIVEEMLKDYQPVAPVDEDVEQDDEEEGEETVEVVAENGAAEIVKKPRKKRTKFESKLKRLDKDLRHKYYDLRDYIKSYGINNRVSIPGDTFSLHRERYAFITIAGTKIKIWLALDPAKYADSPIPVEPAKTKKFEDLPSVFKVKSDLSFRRAKKLIDDVMAAKGIEKPAEPEAK